MQTVYERTPGGSPVQIDAGLYTKGFSVTAGNDYLISMDAALGAPGEVNLWMEWIPTTPPPNDNLANATDLGSSDIVCDGAWLLYATPESTAPNEDLGFPAYSIPGDYTAWWKWTCPHSGTYRFTPFMSDGNTTINVYAGAANTGTFVSGTNGALNNGVTIATTASTIYWIQIKTSFANCTRAELSIYPAATETSYFSQFNRSGIYRLLGSQRLPDADPDGDSFSNQIEFACGANPESHNPNDPQLPHLLSNGSGGWNLRWREDGAYTGTYPGSPLTLRAVTSTDLTNPWSTATSNADPAPSYHTVTLPNAGHGFARLELIDPNLAPPGP
jgi:hypothetical protein